LKLGESEGGRINDEGTLYIETCTCSFDIIINMAPQRKYKQRVSQQQKRYKLRASQHRNDTGSKLVNNRNDTGSKLVNNRNDTISKLVNNRNYTISKLVSKQKFLLCCVYTSILNRKKNPTFFF